MIPSKQGVSAIAGFDFANLLSNGSWLRAGNHLLLDVLPRSKSVDHTYNIRCAELEDLPQLTSADWLSDPDKIERKIANQEMLVCSEGGQITGLLRYSWFWDHLPFINLLWIEEGFRREGRGFALVEHLIEETKGRNSQMILTSTQSNEDAQNFWRRIGFVDSGGFAIKEQPFELLMIKYLPTAEQGADDQTPTAVAD